VQSARQLELLKTLGDNTRYAIYLEVARAPRPVSTADVAETLGLHVNTVRPHLERMREVGLLEVRAEPSGVGRPQHRFSLADDAPSLGLEPAAFPRLARVLVGAAARADLTGEILDAGREQGALDAATWPSAVACTDALEAEQHRQGFDPAVVADPHGAVVAFTHCPYRELAEQHPDVVCALHQGMVEGFVAARGSGEVVQFRSLVDRDPCRVELVP
jgi:predicted ArsR family transcriptional regulator